ncbi:hypothetical protein pEaSNUABM45_00096 [Erwinia phage pEa_SNUABM_45]|nr:hypothetical protein pEaSNUABM45_00096 [Erwinia phage pEa_SNUABM_45]
MLFASSGAKLLEKKLALARRRVFLFTDDTVPPTAQSTAASAMNTINLARSFSQYVANDTFQCTRMAGYRSMRYYHTMIDNPTYGSTLPTAAESVVWTPQEVFRRYYSVGTLFAEGSVVTMQGSLLDNTNIDGKRIPSSASMLLPVFDSTITEANLSPKCAVQTGVTVPMSDSNSGNIGTIGNWSSSDSSSITNVYMDTYTYSDATNVMVRSGIVGQSALIANAQTTLSSAPARSLRVLYSWRTNVYGTRYFSGGGWSYSTSYSKGALNNTTNFVETDRLYSVPLVTRADTPATKLTWAMLPIAFDPQHPCMVQVLREGTDFTHATSTLPGDIPQISVATITDVALTKTVSL